MTATSEVPAETETVMPGDVTTTPGITVTGEVNDIILDLDNTRVAYVIVGTGGFLEIGEKDVLVPWDSLDVQMAGSGVPQEIRMRSLAE